MPLVGKEYSKLMGGVESGGDGGLKKRFGPNLRMKELESYLTLFVEIC